MLSIDCQPASPLGLWGLGQKDVLPAFFLKEGTGGEWVSESLPGVLASGKGSRQLSHPGCGFSPAKVLTGGQLGEGRTQEPLPRGPSPAAVTGQAAPTALLRLSLLSSS